jgi:hypothetical protein
VAKVKENSPFNPRVVFGLIALGIAAFAAVIWVMAYGGPVRQQEREVSRAQMLSPAAVGFKGLVQLVGRVRQVYQIGNARDLNYGDLLVIAIDENTKAEELSWVRQQRASRPTLIILPKWRTIANLRGGQWVTMLGPGAGHRVAASLGYQLRIGPTVAPGTILSSGGDLSGVSIPAPSLPQTVEGGGLTPLLTLPNGDAVLAQIEGRPHYLLADPDLLNNYGIGDRHRAQAALALLDGLNGGEGNSINFATFSDVPTTREAGSLLRVMIEPPFLAMTLALVIAALLAGFHGAIRFGQPRREARTIALGKAALVDNTAGLIRLARREMHMSVAYAELIQQETARAVGAPSGLSGEALDDYLDRLTRTGPTFSELASALVKTRDRHSMTAAARALFQWKKDIIR